VAGLTCSYQEVWVVHVMMWLNESAAPLAGLGVDVHPRALLINVAAVWCCSGDLLVFTAPHACFLLQVMCTCIRALALPCAKICCAALHSQRTLQPDQCMNLCLIAAILGVETAVGLVDHFFLFTNKVSTIACSFASFWLSESLPPHFVTVVCLVANNPRMRDRAPELVLLLLQASFFPLLWCGAPTSPFVQKPVNLSSTLLILFIHQQPPRSDYFSAAHLEAPFAHGALNALGHSKACPAASMMSGLCRC
jgi:hypothetical protein